jgi:hypothetical protein
VINFTLEKFEFRIGKQWPDIDISRVEACYNNGRIDFNLTVYGEIKNDYSYRYYFDVFQVEDDRLEYWFMLDFWDGNTTLFYYDNDTLIDLLNQTTIDDDTITISLDVEFLGDYRYLKVVGYAIIPEFIDLNTYMDSTEPVEEGLRRQPSIWIVILIVLVVFILIAIVLFVVFGKKWRREFRFKFKKKCPNCGVIFSRRMKKCNYCGINLDGT